MKGEGHCLRVGFTTRYMHLPLRAANLCHFCFHLPVLEELRYMKVNKRHNRDITIVKKSNYS